MTSETVYNAVKELATGAGRSEILQRRVEFVPASSKAGAYNAAGSTSQAGLGAEFEGFEIHVVETKKEAEIAAPEGEQESNLLGGREPLDDPFFKYLPKSELYADAKVGNWERLLRWQKISSVGPGFDNLGNTCFLNSVLQCLTYLPAFSQLCLTGPEGKSLFDIGCEPLSAIANRAATVAKSRGSEDRFCALDSIVKHMQAIHVSILSDPVRSLGKRASIPPIKFVKNLRKMSRSTMIVGIQHDAHEFLRLLVDRMQESCALAAGLKETAMDRILETSAIMRIFGGYTESVIRCGITNCSATSSSFEPFMDLSLEIANAEIKTLSDALQTYFAKEELDGMGVWNCPSCGKVDKASKKLSIRRSPNVLVLHLKRFGFGTRGKKLNKLVQYEPTLHLESLFTQTADLDQQSYELTGVVVHCGTILNLGHYISFIRAANGLWYEMDDHSVRQVSISRVLSQPAYLLFYSKVAPDFHTVVGNGSSESGVAVGERTGGDEVTVNDNGEHDDGDVNQLAAFAQQFECKKSDITPASFRSDLFGDFLTNDEGDDVGKVGEIPEQTEAEPVVEVISKQSSTSYLIRRPPVSPAPAFWKYTFSSSRSQTRRIARQVELSRFHAYGTRKVRLSIDQLARLDHSIDEKNSSKEPSQPISTISDSNQDKQSDTMSISSDEDDREENIAIEVDMASVEGGTQGRLSKKRVLEQAAKSDMKVILVQKPTEKRAEAAQSWAEKLKADRKKSKKKNPQTGDGGETRYDEWDAALDRGRVKKVKAKEAEDSKARGPNRFQQTQNKKNIKEKARRGLK